MSSDTQESEGLDLLARVRSPADFAGQQLFIEGDDWRNNAVLGWGGFPWDTYAAGYRKAADVLVAAVEERKAPVDMVVYPLVFLYRQALELELKLMLPLARRLADQAPRQDVKHQLMPMWQELRRYLHQLGTPESDPQILSLESFISQLDAVDPGSFAFRYPTDKKGEVSLPNLRHINVRHLAEIMGSVFMLLGGTHSWLGEMDQVDGIY